jgi:hypothetical protein
MSRDVFVQGACKEGFSFAGMGLGYGREPKRFGKLNLMERNWKKPLDWVSVCGNTKAV